MCLSSDTEITQHDVTFWIFQIKHLFATVTIFFLFHWDSPSEGGNIYI